MEYLQYSYYYLYVTVTPQAENYQYAAGDSNISMPSPENEKLQMSRTLQMHSQKHMKPVRMIFSLQILLKYIPHMKKQWLIKIMREYNVYLKMSYI